MTIHPRVTALISAGLLAATSLPGAAHAAFFTPASFADGTITSIDAATSTVVLDGRASPMSFATARST